MHAGVPRVGLARNRSLQVIYKLGGLKFLDSRPVTAAEKKEAARVGPYLKVARPKEDSVRGRFYIARAHGRRSGALTAMARVVGKSTAL